MTTFRDRVAVITGAASGIGRQLAVQLAAEGAKIAALDRQDDGLQKLAAELDGKPFARAAVDVTDLAAVRAAVRQLEAQLGGADLLFAAAGIGRKTPGAAFNAEDINAIIQVNLQGVVNCIDAVLPGMKARRRGHLVVLSSVASYRGLPLMAGYCASKAGVNALFDALRIELPPLGVAVTTVCPGWVRTPMTAHLNLPDREVMAVERAAAIILDAVRRNRPFIAFPASKVWQVRLLRYLPRPWSDWLTRRHLARLADKIGES